MSQSEPPPFEEPWQAEALALSMALMQAGRFSAAEWATGLGSAIARAQAAGDPDDGSTYYWHVLNALEALAFEKTFATRDALAARKEAWRAAYASTPHGQLSCCTGSCRQPMIARGRRLRSWQGDARHASPPRRSRTLALTVATSRSALARAAAQAAVQILLSELAASAGRTILPRGAASSARGSDSSPPT